MSSTEQGRGGIWTCLYCDGAWLPGGQARSLATAEDARAAGLPDGGWAACGRALACPQCTGLGWHGVAIAGACGLQCDACEGVFLDGRAASSIARRAARARAEAPVAAALLATFGTIALLGDALAWVLARAWHERGRGAAAPPPPPPAPPAANGMPDARAPARTGRTQAGPDAG